MLYQAGRMEVPGSDAFVATTSVRAPRFGIATMFSRGVVTDWGLQAPLVHYIARQRRTQLSILLGGRGYFELSGRALLLSPGDMVLSDQSLHGDEGYGGSPALVLLLDWEGAEPLGPVHRGQPVHSRLSRADLVRLRAITARAGSTAPRTWAAEVIGALRDAGLPAPPPDARDELFDATPRLARLYAALADVRTQLDRHPALDDVADTVGVSGRQLRRAFDRLDQELGTGTGGWREFLSDTRIGVAQQLLSVPGVQVGEVARLAGFRSSVALCHAFAERGELSPGGLARLIRERWDQGGVEDEGPSWNALDASR